MTEPTAPLSDPLSFLLVPGRYENGYYAANTGAGVVLQLDGETARGLAERMDDLQAVAGRWDAVAELDEGPEPAAMRGYVLENVAGTADFEVWLEEAAGAARSGEAVSISPDLAAEEMWNEGDHGILFRRFVQPDHLYWTYMPSGPGAREQRVERLTDAHVHEAWLAQATGDEVGEAFRRLGERAPRTALRVLDHGGGPRIGDARRRDVTPLLVPEDLVGLQQHEDLDIRERAIGWLDRVGQDERSAPSSGRTR